MARGRHRKPTNTARNVQRASLTGLAIASGVSTIALPAEASIADPTWGAIAKCESGGQNIESHSRASSASGYFQIIDGTWASAGGTQFAPRAIGASYAEQLEIANRIHDRAGSFRDWNASKSCWAPMLSHPPAAPAPEPPKVVPAPAPKPVDKPAVGEKYEVTSGDTLFEIATAHGLPGWKPLYEGNRSVIGNDPDLIFPGQTLSVALSKPAVPAKKSTPAQAVAGDYANPLPGATLTSGYRTSHRPGHDGIDLAAPHGTPIHAAHSGKVIRAGIHDPKGYGALVEIEDWDGYRTLYAHIDTWQVKPGDFVFAGEQIATVGKRGHATGYHLHFEVRIGPGQINPGPWLSKHGIG